MYLLPQKSFLNIKHSTLILWGFATIFFPRFFVTTFNFPSPINFAHFLIIPAIVGIIILNARIQDRKQIIIAIELSVGLGILFTVMVASAALNQAGLVNVFISYMLLAEPYIFLLAFVLVPLNGEEIQQFRNTIMIFGLINFLIAVAQFILIPAGIWPKPEGGTFEDNVTGVFGGGGGSAGNYISCTITVYFGLYFAMTYKRAPTWLKVVAIFAGHYQNVISDSKQVLLALAGGLILLIFTKFNQLRKLILYTVLAVVSIYALYWAIYNIDLTFLAAFKNWLDRDGLFGPDGEATITKLAAFRIIPNYYDNPLDWLFGLGSGHGASRLGGWILRDYANMLLPLGATIHPASQELVSYSWNSWLVNESTVYFPLFTWAGIWSDIGIVGLISYLFLAFITWRRLCVDDFCKYLMLSTAFFGLIITQMEEPGQVLTVAVLLGLRWQEAQHRERKKAALLADENPVIPVVPATPNAYLRRNR